MLASLLNRTSNLHPPTLLLHGPRNRVVVVLLLLHCRGRASPYRPGEDRGEGAGRRGCASERAQRGEGAHEGRHPFCSAVVEGLVVVGRLEGLEVAEVWRFEVQKVDASMSRAGDDGNKL